MIQVEYCNIDTNVTPAERGIISTAIGMLINELDEETSRYADELPKGWRYRLHCSLFGLTLALAKDNGGSFAEAKLKTLLLQPKLQATGQDPTDILRFLQFGDHKLAVSQDLISTVNRYTGMGLEGLPLEIERRLRDELSITGLLGAFRVPVKFATPDINPMYPGPSTIDYNEREGEIISSFSGARSEQDIYFAAKALKIFKEAYDQLALQDYLKLCFSNLLNNPAITFQLKQVNLLQ